MEKVDIKNQILDKLTRKQALVLMMVLSSGSDILFTTLGWSFALPSVFSTVVGEEVIEYFISTLAAKHLLGIELSMMDKAKGFLPIPGITALSLKCLSELRKLP